MTFKPNLSLSTILTALLLASPQAVAQEEGAAQPASEAAAEPEAPAAEPAEAAPESAEEPKAEDAPAEAPPAEEPQEAQQPPAEPEQKPADAAKPEGAGAAKPEGAGVVKPEGAGAVPADGEKKPAEGSEQDPAKKAKKDEKDKKGKKEPPRDYHADTPSELKNRLFLSTAANLGIGIGDESDFSSDFLGFEIQGLYALTKDKSKSATLTYLTGFKYATHTGVRTDANRELAVQRFLILGTAEYRQKKSKFKFGAQLGLGATKATATGFQSLNTFVPEYGFSTSVQLHVAYRVYKKISLISGLEASYGTHSWYGLNIGPRFSF